MNMPITSGAIWIAAATIGTGLSWSVGILGELENNSFMATGGVVAGLSLAGIVIKLLFAQQKTLGNKLDAAYKAHIESVETLQCTTVDSIRQITQAIEKGHIASEKHFEQMLENLTRIAKLNVIAIEKGHQHEVATDKRMDATDKRITDP